MEIDLKNKASYVKGREEEYDASYHQGCFLLVGAFICLPLKSKSFQFFFFHLCVNYILGLVQKSSLNWSESKWLHVIHTCIHTCLRCV